ncbi:hypothetical protein MMC09_006136 [Bachmanniomyces sp. S44760]|nr:hypothetical protein [Bachmanniomyces sp. S44760]
MVQFYPSIPPDLQEWALKQSIFYTASAPLTGTHVNLSPKGLPSATFAIFGPNSAGYIDATGSGSETISHIYENGRVTIMFCSFGTSPRIMRFFCRGRVVERGDGGFESEVKRMGKGKGEVLGARAVILLDVWKVQTSCGFGVPLLDTFKAEATPSTHQPPKFKDRETMSRWASKKLQSNSLHTYQADNNADSLDGLPGLKSARREKGEVLWWGDLKAWVRRVRGQWEAVVVGMVLGMLVVWFGGRLVEAGAGAGAGRVEALVRSLI